MIDKMNLGNEAIGEMWMTTMITLFDSVGHEASIQALRPRLKLHGEEGQLMMTREMGIDDEPLMLIANSVNLGTVAAGLPSKTELAERGVILTVYDCPFGRTGRDIFCIIHSFLHEGIYEAIDPRYTPRHIKWLPRGDPFCQHVIIKKDVPPENWTDCGKVVCTLIRPSIPMEEVMELGREYVGSLFVIAVDAFVDSAGSQTALAVLRPLMVKCGQATGLKISRMLSVSEDKDAALEDVLSLLCEALRQSAEVRPDGTGVIMSIERCPFQDAAIEVCELIDAFIEGVTTTIEPDGLPSITRTGVGPQRVCHWRVERPRNGHRSGEKNGGNLEVDPRHSTGSSTFDRLKL